MYDLIRDYLQLSDAAVSFLQEIEQQISIIADLSRADILLYSRKSEMEALILAHAQPNSQAHVYSKNRKGRVITSNNRPEVWRALLNGTVQQEQLSKISEGASVVRQALPIYYPPPIMNHSGDTTASVPKAIGSLVIVNNLIEYERHRLRSKVFKRALKKLQLMGLYGQLRGTESLTPFGEQDGIMVVNNEGIIQYVSGVGANLYRRLGYRQTLIGHHLSEMDTDDEDLWREALALDQPLEREVEEANRVSIRKVIPLKSLSSNRWRWLSFLNLSSPHQNDGAFITLHDETEARRQDQELRVKNAMIQEVHHRVKNNLQTIAGLLRMKLRRVKSDEAKEVLEETLHRILSIAVIHEFLSYKDANIINIKDVANRIASQLHQGMVDPSKNIRLEVQGLPVYLPARQATATSLILNELLQNAIEHGFEHKQAGTIQVNLADEGDQVMINVSDDGVGLPADFQFEGRESLGLHIIKILVEGDLKGQLDFQNHANKGAGLSITITFPKSGFEGEEGWNAHVSL